MSEPGLTEMQVGEAHTFPVLAQSPWNASRLRLVEGKRYRFQVSEVENWRDKGHPATPGEGLLAVPWLLRIFGSLRRFRGANWYTLVGNIGQRSSQSFLIGSGGEQRALASGELFAFANDAWGFYGNNEGALKITVTRIEDPD